MDKEIQDKRIYVAMYDREVYNTELVKYESLYRTLWSYRGSLHYKMRCIIDYMKYYSVGCMHINGEAYTAMTYRELVSTFGGSYSGWQRAIHILVYWRMLDIHNPNNRDNNTWVDQWAREYQSRSKKYNSAIYYKLTKWSDEVLSWAEAHADIRGLRTFTGFSDAIGERSAKEIYDTQRRISESTLHIRNVIDRFIFNTIDKKGYCTSAEICRAIRCKDKQGHIINTKYVLRVYRKDLLNKYGDRLSFRRPTADQKKEYGLKSDQYIYTTTSFFNDMHMSQQPSIL